MELEKIRRLVRAKAFNVLERIDQLDGPTQVEVEHLSAAIKYLSKMWDECRAELSLPLNSPLSTANCSATAATTPDQPVARKQ